MKAAEAYSADPSAENTLHLLNALPQVQVPESSRGDEFRKVFYYIDGNVLDKLNRQVLEADRTAVKTWIRLYAIADGAFAEWLNDGMGDLIRVDPQMFLEELGYYPGHDLEQSIDVGYMVCNGHRLFDLTTEETYEASKEAIKELELRIRALEKVKDSDLRQLRDVCIKRIRTCQYQLNMMAEEQEHAIDWDSIAQATEVYFLDPSAENATDLYEALPKIQVRGKDRRGAFSVVYSQISDHLPLLRELVKKGDRNSVKIAVRLWNMADTVFTEQLRGMLGQLIRVDPRLFLAEISDFPWPDDYEKFKDWLRQGYIVCDGVSLTPNGEKADDGAIRKELEMRIKALNTVTEKELVELRDICITAIQEELAKTNEVECFLPRKRGVVQLIIARGASSIAVGNFKSI
jgi:hypothetical protein